LNKGGTFQQTISWGGTGLAGDNLVAGDLTGDGFDDILGAGGAYVPGGSGDTPSTPQVSLTALRAVADGMAISDVNEDGDLDIVAFYANADWMTGQFGGPYGVVVFLNRSGDAGLPDFVPVGMGINTHGATVVPARLDANTSPDLVAFAPGAVNVALGNGDGTFGVPHRLYSPTSDLSGGGAVGDFNGDGFLDVAPLLEDAKTLRVFLGDGNGSFYGPEANDGGSLRGFDIVSTAPLTRLVRSFEMSGDAIDDLVALDGAGRVHVLVSSGKGLADEVILPTASSDPSAFTALGVGDLNGDGTVDVVTPEFGGGGALKAFLIFR
jgi:hypothetical protein